jgi:hypothetical protein
MGMVAGLIYLVTMFLFIPFPFMKWFTASQDGDLQELTLLTFPNLKVSRQSDDRYRDDPSSLPLTLRSLLFATIACRTAIGATLHPVHGVFGLCRRRA